MHSAKAVQRHDERRTAARIRCNALSFKPAPLASVTFPSIRLLIYVCGKRILSAWFSVFSHFTSTWLIFFSQPLFGALDLLFGAFLCSKPSVSWRKPTRPCFAPGPSAAHQSSGACPQGPCVHLSLTNSSLSHQTTHITYYLLVSSRYFRTSNFLKSGS